MCVHYKINHLCPLAIVTEYPLEIVIGPTDKQLLPDVVVMFSAMLVELYAIAFVAAEPKY
jgi:hypothetical protein